MARTKKKAAAMKLTPRSSEPGKTPEQKKPARKRPMKKAQKYRRYSDAERSRILTAARRDNLTGVQVQKRFGVTTVTYYSWRKKAGVKRGTGRLRGAVGGGGALGSQLRGEIQERIRTLLPDLVLTEVNRYLDSALGSSGKRRGKS